MQSEQQEAELLSGVAYERLRSDIVSGALEPGQQLKLNFLRDRYGIGFSPLREALNQLRVEQLVISSSNKGFRVSEISLAQMWDTIRTRVLIEGAAIAQAIEHGDDEWESNIVRSFYALDKARIRLAEAQGDRALHIDTMEGRHRDFHRSLTAACNSPMLMHLSDNLYMQTERYRRPLLSSTSREMVKNHGPHEEHRLLMDAALERDAKSAQELLGQHLTNTGRFIEERHLLPTCAVAAA